MVLVRSLIGTYRSTDPVPGQYHPPESPDFPMKPLDWVRHLEHAAGLKLDLDEPLPSGALGRSGTDRSDRDAQVWGDGDRPIVWQDLLEPGSGPLRSWPEDRAIEVWTEEELACLHGLWRFARRGSDEVLRSRLLAAARWHLDNTQPDNATNRPWGLHVFLLEGSAEGRVYAETLLHNATAIRAQVTPVSAWILADAAAELRAVVSLGDR
jgi:hypothetical protein